MQRFNTILFDFDGTIIDSAQGIIDSVIYALEKFGAEVPERDSLRFFIGPPLFDSFKKICDISDDEANLLVSYYREFYGPVGHSRCRVYDGIPELLQKCREAGIKTAVASAKPEKFVKEIIAEKGLSELFDVVCGIDFKTNSADKKPILLRALAECGAKADLSVAMVGDRCYDIDAAAELGVYPVGVSYGFGTTEELMLHNAAEIAADTDGLCKILLQKRQ